MTTTYDFGYVCQCCALATVNGDTSGCEAHCGDAHVERLAQYGLEAGETIVIDDTEVTVLARCVGCGDDDMTSYRATLVA